MVPLKYHTTHKDKWSINKLMTICVKKKRTVGNGTRRKCNAGNVGGRTRLKLIRRRKVKCLPNLILRWNPHISSLK
jgi:hypothetical protein